MDMSKFKSDLLYHVSPNSIQRQSLNMLSDALNDIDVVDPTSAFMALLGTACALTASGIENSEAVTLTHNPLMAITEDDLYKHMSDLDYIDRFSTPAKTTITFLIPYELLLQHAVYLNNSKDVKTVKFPKYTKVTVNGIDLSTSYPIMVEVYPYDQIQVRYDITENSPMEVLTTNVLEHYKTVLNGESYLCIKVPMQQYYIISGKYAVESTVSFSKVIHIKDNYFFCRVYTDLNGVWTEITTTHSPVVYDITTLTAVIRVVGKVISVTIPEIYSSRRMLGKNVRIDVFSTKGHMDIDLSTFSIDKYSASWYEYDSLISKVGSNALNNINDMKFFCDTRLSGGSRPKTLEELRRNIVYRNLGNTVPIRESDTVVNLSKLGYTVSKYIDTVTNRMYVASKRLPKRERNKLRTNVLVCNLNVLFNLNKDYITSNYNTSVIMHKSGRVSVLPTSIYKVKDSTTVMLTDTEKYALLGLTGSNLVQTANKNTFLYSPFNYVIDTTKTVTNVKCFNLHSPTVVSRTLESINSHRDYNVNTTNVTINNDGDYVIKVMATKPSGLNNIHCQLRYTDKNNNLLYLLSTEEVYKTYNVYTFVIKTTADINGYDEIEVTNGSNSFNKPMVLFIGLLSKFDLIYTTDGEVNQNNSTVFDGMYIKYINSIAQSGVTHETLTLRLGTRLSNLYTPLTECIEVNEGAVYEHDVTAVYTDDVYEKDTNGFIKINIVNGKVEYSILHKKGDVVLDDTLQPVIAHKKGDLVVSNYGSGINEKALTSVTYNVGLTLVDYKYTIGNTADIIDYRINIPKVIEGYLRNEITPNAGTLHELTKLYYCPSGSPIDILCNVGDNTVVPISGKLSLTVKYYLTEDGMSNTQLKNDLTKMTRNVISNAVDKERVSISELTGLLKAQTLTDVLSFHIEKINGMYSTIAVVNTNDRFNIDEVLVIMPDGSIDIVDAISIEFLKSN